MLGMRADLFTDIEDGGDWQNCVKEIITGMIPKGSEPNSDDVATDSLMAGAAAAMRPINNASPVYSAWSPIRWATWEVGESSGCIHQWRGQDPS